MWKPWKGQNYKTRRLLLLGESCYSWIDSDGTVCHPQPEHPATMVGWTTCEPRKDQRFVTMLTRGLSGEQRPSVEQSKIAWDTVAFTNYVPVSVGIGPGERPSYEMWKQASDEWAAI